MKAIITDLDRTLLRTDKTVSAYTLSVLKRCREKGMLLLVASARPLRTIAPYHAQIGFDAINSGALKATVLQTPGYQIEKVIQIINEYIVPGKDITDRNQFSGHYVIHAGNSSEYKAEY